MGVKAITREEFIELWEAGVRCLSASGINQAAANKYLEREGAWYATESDWLNCRVRDRATDGWFFAVAVE